MILLTFLLGLYLTYSLIITLVYYFIDNNPQHTLCAIKPFVLISPLLLQYANFQNLDHMTDYLIRNGFADTFGLIA